MATETQVTVEDFTKVLNLLNPQNQNALLLLGEGMAIANNISYNELKNRENPERP